MTNEDSFGEVKPMNTAKTKELVIKLVPRTLSKRPEDCPHTLCTSAPNKDSEG